jgi:hypothetical protein
MKLDERLSALVYYRDETDGLHVVVTTHQGVSEKAALERFETVLVAGQSACGACWIRGQETLRPRRSPGMRLASYVLSRVS